MIKSSIVILLFLVFVSGFSQTNLNTYKYVIVPNQYDFLNKADQFQLNSLSEFLFNKHGFVALMESSQFPEDLKNDRCLALISNVISDKKLFKTSLSIILKDCNNKQVYESKQGESREKEYKIAYNQALRDAFKSLSTLNHKYEPSEEATSIKIASEIKKEESKITSQAFPVVAEVTKKREVSNSLKASKTESITPSVSSSDSTSNVLYAQAIDNGFQLVDSTPKVIYKLLKTSVEDVFLVEGKEAIIYKSNKKWVLEFYENGSLKQEGLNLKF